MTDKLFEKNQITNQYRNLVDHCLNEHFKLASQLLNDTHCTNAIAEISAMMIQSYLNGRKLLLCGNGGSAADAQHLAAELVSRFYIERKALAAEALTVNTSIITAIANDYSYRRIFARQVEAKGENGDILIGLSTSGKSENIFEAFQMAKEMGITTILFTGTIDENEKILQYTDCLLNIPSKNTPRIQEMHILAGHIICEIVEKELSQDQTK